MDVRHNKEKHNNTSTGDISLYTTTIYYIVCKYVYRRDGGVVG